MTLAAISIPGFNNGVSQQAPVNRRPDQGELQLNGLGTLVDGLMQRPGTEHLACLTSNATTGVFTHTINRDTTFRYIVLMTGDPTEPIEIFDLTGTKLTVQYGDLDADLNYTADNSKKAYALPWIDTDLVTNGDFATDTDWIKGTGWTISGGTASSDGTQTGWSYLNQDALTIGKTYLITYTVSNRTAGSCNSMCGNAVSGATVSADGTYQDVLTCAGNTYLYIVANVDFIGDIDNVSVVELDTTSNPSEVFKAVTVADNTFVINRGITVGKTADVDAETLDYTVQTFADLPASPANGETAKITGDDISGFSAWYVQWDNTKAIWEECIGPGVELGRLKDYTMAHRLVRTSTTTFTFAPCIWDDRSVGDTNTAPDPSFITNKLQNVFFFKNRLAFLSEDNVIFSETGEYFNFYPKTALDVLDSDPIDGSATSKQVEILRSVAVFDKSLIMLADQQQFDLGGGEGPLTPTSVAITPTTRFNICPLCEPVTAGPNVYFVCPKTDWATIREYYVQPDSLLNDAADITAHVPQYIPMGHIQMQACNSLDMLLVHSDADPDAIYNYKYFWSGEDKAQAAWSKWEFSGDVLGFGIIGTVAYLVIERDDVTCLEKIQLETTSTGNLTFRVHLDRLTNVQGSYSSTTELTTFTLPYDFGEFRSGTSHPFTIVDPTTGRPLIGVDAATDTTLTITGDYSTKTYHIGENYEFNFQLTPWYLLDQQGRPRLQGRLQVRTLVLNYKDTGYFEVHIEPEGRDEMTHIFSGAVIGKSVLGAVTLLTGEERFTVRGRNTLTDITIVTNSYLPVAFQSGSWEGVYYPRGRE